MSTNEHAARLRKRSRETYSLISSDVMEPAADEIDRLEKELEQSRSLRATADQLEAARIEARDFQALVTLTGHALAGLLANEEWQPGFGETFPARAAAFAAESLAAIKEHTDAE